MSVVFVLYGLLLFFLAFWLMMSDLRLEAALLGFLILAQALIAVTFQLSVHFKWGLVETFLVASICFHLLAIMRALIINLRLRGRRSSDELQILRG